MISITTTSLPVHIKCLHQPLEVNSTTHAHMGSTPTVHSHSISCPATAAVNLSNNDIIYLSDLTDIAEANHD